MESDFAALERATVAVQRTSGAAAGAAERSLSLALCLSGGGYRAAIFHLGALLRLQECVLLQRTQLISSVSGGSIAAGWLARRFLDDAQGSKDFADWLRQVDFLRSVVLPFQSQVASRDIRSLAVLLTLPFNWLWPSPRARLLQAAYARFLGATTLADLPEQPRFCFCATDLTFGVNWEFSRERVGDYQAGYIAPGRTMPLAFAVAASSAFPPIFGPLRIRCDPSEFQRGRYSGADGSELRRAIELSDGGVYDNLGMEPALRRYREVMISDAGAPFAFKPGRHYLRRLLRYTEVMGGQAGALRKRLYFALRYEKHIDGAYWNLVGNDDSGADGYSAELIGSVIARIRTDLDSFSAAEFAVLVNHGYFTCHNALAASKTYVEATTSAPPQWPFPDFADEQRVRATLRHSRRRFWPARWFAG